MRSRLFPEFAEGAEGRSGVKAQGASGLWPQQSLVKGCAEEKAPGQRKHRTSKQHDGPRMAESRVLGKQQPWGGTEGLMADS